VFLELLLITATTTSTASTTADEREAAALERIEKAAERIANAAEKMAGIKTPPADAPAEAKKDDAVWTANVGVGLIWLAGNSETLTVNGNATAEVKFPSWILSAKASGAYGEASSAEGSGDPQVTALQAALTARADRRFTETVTAYVLGGVDTDHVKSIEVRGTAEAGASLIWFEDKKEDFVVSSLRTDLGFRYQKEGRYQFYPTEMDLPDVKLIAPRLALAFRYALSEGLIFTEDADIAPDIVDNPGRFLLNTTSKLSVRLTQSLSFGVGLTINHDSEPAPDKEKTDSALNISLEVSI
jgi:putative salt-induced outer membrane protein YdiY